MQLHHLFLRQGETNLLIKSDLDRVLEPIRDAVSRARGQLASHMEACPEFRWSLEPLDPPAGPLPEFIFEMYRAGSVAGVGPFASVAGALACVAARAAVEAGASNIIVENGGDLCLFGEGPFLVGVFAASSSFSRRIGFRVTPGPRYIGLCTSSGTVGESVSFGEADAVVAYSPTSVAVADAAATSICNEVRGPRGVVKGIEKAKKIGHVGVLIVQRDRLGAWGRLPELVGLDPAAADLIADPNLHSRA